MSKFELCAIILLSFIKDKNSSTISINFGLSCKKSLFKPCTLTASSGTSISGFIYKCKKKYSLN